MSHTVSKLLIISCYLFTHYFTLVRISHIILGKIMGRTTTPLSDLQIKNTNPREKEYTLSDGNGLQLRIMPNGTKSWRQLYQHPLTRKAQKISLGKYPDLSLSNARKKSNNIRSLVAQDIDPKEFKRDRLLEHEAKHQHTLINVARMWMDRKKNEVSEDHATDIWRSLDLHIFPALQNIPISDISAPLAIKALKPLEAKGSLETVKRVAQRLNEVMIYAVNCGLVESNQLNGIKAAFHTPKKENMKSLAPHELPELMRTVARASIRRTTRYLIEFQLHTMTRPNEAAGARWEEFDFNSNVWTIPASRMKKDRDHRIPLTKQVLTLLEHMREISGTREYVFPADRDPKKPTNSQTANAALKRMGFKNRTVSHGLRALASTTLNETGTFDYKIIEAALAHVIKDATVKAYNRSDYLELRVPMMDWWSKHIVTSSKGYSSLSQEFSSKNNAA